MGKLKDKTKIEEICKDFCILSEDILYKETVEINSYNEFAKKYKEFSDLLYNIEIIGDDSYYKRKIMSSLNKIANILELFSHKNILVRGLAGTGKTHLVCDLVREAVETNQFISVLFFGNRFYEHSLEKAILSQVPEFDSLDIFLSTLNSYARIKKQIAYLIIDAINEWDTLKNSDKFCEVNLIINKIKSYSNIKFIITCREEYIDDIFKKTDNIYEIKRINGFCNNIMEAFYSFCKYYNIKYPTKLCLFPEISNPLILKTICETFKNRDFPDNYLSISDVIQTYLETINVSISEKLNIDSKDNLVIKEIKKIVEILYRNKSSFISRDKIKSKVQRFEWKDEISVEEYNKSIHCRSVIHDGKKKGHLNHEMNCKLCGLCWKGKCKGRTILVYNH